MRSGLNRTLLAAVSSALALGSLAVAAPPAQAGSTGRFSVYAAIGYDATADAFSVTKKYPKPGQGRVTFVDYCYLDQSYVPGTQAGVNAICEGTLDDWGLNADDGRWYSLSQWTGWPAASCLDGIVGVPDIAVTGPLNTKGNVSFYTSSFDGTCSGSPSVFAGGAIVSGADETAALAACALVDVAWGLTGPISSGWPAAPVTWWGCQS